MYWAREELGFEASDELYEELMYLKYVVEEHSKNPPGATEGC